jgi:hypothetical protein
MGLHVYGPTAAITLVLAATIVAATVLGWCVLQLQVLPLSTGTNALVLVLPANVVGDNMLGLAWFLWVVFVVFAASLVTLVAIVALRSAGRPQRQGEAEDETAAA